MLFRKAHELIGNASERIQLVRIVPRTGFEKLIEALFEVDCRGARHVIKVVALAIPGQRRTHRWAIVGMEEEVGTGKVLCFCKCGRRIAEVGGVIVEKRTTILSCCATGERYAHRSHWLDSRSFHTQ